MQFHKLNKIRNVIVFYLGGFEKTFENIYEIKRTETDILLLSEKDITSINIDKYLSYTEKNGNA